MSHFDGLSALKTKGSATRIAEWTSHDDDHRGFACADKKCKTVTPVYNTRAPLEQEQGF